jgi:hypothetical protein
VAAGENDCEDDGDDDQRAGATGEPEPQAAWRPGGSVPLRLQPPLTFAP